MYLLWALASVPGCINPDFGCGKPEPGLASLDVAGGFKPEGRGPLIWNDSYALSNIK